MIRINKVDSLQKERKAVLLNEIKIGEMFTFKGDSQLCLQVEGSRYIRFGDFSSKVSSLREDALPVNPVDAEINWCFK